MIDEGEVVADVSVPEEPRSVRREEVDGSNDKQWVAA